MTNTFNNSILADDEFAILNASTIRLGIGRSALAVYLGWELERCAMGQERLIEHGLLREVGESAVPVGDAIRRVKSEHDKRFTEFRTSGVADRFHRRFRVVNQEFLDLSHAWQIRRVGGALVPNDHADPGYDNQVIDQVHVADRKLRRIMPTAIDAAPHLLSHLDRLSSALERVAQGMTDWFAHPAIDSYHTTWFEMHEDLLRVLGRERGDEEGAK